MKGYLAIANLIVEVPTLAPSHRVNFPYIVVCLHVLSENATIGLEYHMLNVNSFHLPNSDKIKVTSRFKIFTWHISFLTFSHPSIMYPSFISQEYLSRTIRLLEHPKKLLNNFDIFE